MPVLSLMPAESASVALWQVAGSKGEPVDLIWPGDEAQASREHRKPGFFGLPFLFPFANRVFAEGQEGA